jgi:regulatory protein
MEPKRPSARKAPRRISPRYLENAALHYLKRYSATVSQLKRVLRRKVDRSLRVHGGDRAQALGWIDELAEKLIRNGLLNDDRYAETKAQSLRGAGRSARVIALKLRTKGVSEALVKQKVAEATSAISEEEAARTWARKKRLGPFRREAERRKERRSKDLAALARAGFSFSVARQVIDAEDG